MKRSTLKLINDIVISTQARGLTQHVTEDTSYDGKHITIKGKTYINFSSCSYLGLELDERLKEGAIDAIRRYGTQFSSSRSYLACTLYTELEELIQKIFGGSVALSTSVSLGHHGVIPVIVGENDAIIMDQQVHSSVQDAALKMQATGVHVTIIRHNDLEALESKTVELSSRYERIWYMIDGVYSMYGDFAPVKKIVSLLNTHKKLYLYADDAHGMSWAGRNGSGYVLSQTELHPKMVLATSLNKAFAAGGGAFIFTDEELCRKVKNCGGSFMFSGPHQVPVLGAAIASAKIHLSAEIYERQQALLERIDHCNKLLEKKNIPFIAGYNSPIFFVGAGLLRVGHSLAEKILEDGFMVNLSAFPAVPETCTGVRFTITLHQSLSDIENLVNSICANYSKVLAEENRTIEDVYRAFKRLIRRKSESPPDTVKPENNPDNQYRILHRKSISRIPKQTWDRLMSGKGNYDWDFLKMLEQIFAKNPEPENNWSFHYYLIYDKNDIPVLATFFTCALIKDDLLSPKEISRKIETARAKAPYYLTSKSMLMGTLVTEGGHLYIDKQRKDWEQILMQLLDVVWKQQDAAKATSLILRDFSEDTEVSAFFKSQGFLKIEVPTSHTIVNHNSVATEEFLEKLTGEKRYYIRKRAQEFEKYFEVRINQQPTEKELSHYYRLFNRVAARNFEINSFRLPKKLFMLLQLYKKWEAIELFIHPDYRKTEADSQPVAVAINYKSEGKYSFVFTGMNYKYLESLNLYPQILLQILKRGLELGYTNINLGLTASQNKRKFGGVADPRYAYVQVYDKYNQVLIGLVPERKMAARKKVVSKEKILK